MFKTLTSQDKGRDPHFHKNIVLWWNTHFSCANLPFNHPMNPPSCDGRIVQYLLVLAAAPKAMLRINVPSEMGWNEDFKGRYLYYMF